jgi:hypothetical protein
MLTSRLKGTSSKVLKKKKLHLRAGKPSLLTKRSSGCRSRTLILKTKSVN